ncbi:MAG: cytochrome c oxidase accessory protein CcoG [Polyangiales bacterium]
MRSSVRTDGTRATVHPADLRGRFASLRKVLFVVLMAVYVALPWLTVGGRPAVLIDLMRRRFYLFGALFNAQDVWMMFFVLSGIGFALVTLTTVAGRVWCGFGCPQTVWLEGLFRPFQRLIEGSREKRLRREAGGWTFDRIWRRVLLWTIYFVLAAGVSHAFLGYFTPIRELGEMIKAGPAESPQAFAWTAAMTAVLFFNFAWFREQTCMIICPYGRLQSVLTDPDTIVIGYDTKRGEPRKHQQKGAKAEGVGDCIDCNRCFVVCPTGIDIRNGLQLDCIGCARCIDACDEVMDRLERPRGLVRYDSLKGLHHEPKRFLRPRLYLYAVLGVAGIIAATIGFSRHKPFEANLLRITGAPYVLDAGTVRNAYNIHLVNKQAQRVTFDIVPDPHDGQSFLIPLPQVTLEPLVGTNIPVFVTVDERRFHGDTTVRLSVRPEGMPAETTRQIEAPFLGPSR